MALHAAPPLLLRRALLPALLLLVSTGALLYIGGDSLLKIIKTIPADFLCALLILPCLRWGFLVIRLQLLLKVNGLKFRRRDILATQWAYDFAAESTPGNLGGPLLVLACCRVFNIPVSTATSISLLTLTLDVAAASIIFAIAISRSSFIVNQAVHWQLMVFFTLVFITIASLWALAKYRRQLQRQLSNSSIVRSFKKHQTRKAQRFWRRIELALDRVKELKSPEIFLLILSSLGIWASRLSVIYFVILAIPGIHYLSWPDALIIQFISSLAGILVLLPGGLLGADIATATLLLPFFDIKTIAVIILLWRLLTFHVNFLVGGISLLWISSKIAKLPQLQNETHAKV